MIENSIYHYSGHTIYTSEMVKKRRMDAEGSAQLLAHSECPQLVPPGDTSDGGRQGCTGTSPRPSPCLFCMHSLQGVPPTGRPALLAGPRVADLDS